MDKDWDRDRDKDWDRGTGGQGQGQGQGDMDEAMFRSHFWQLMCHQKLPFLATLISEFASYHLWQLLAMHTQFMLNNLLLNIIVKKLHNSLQLKYFMCSTLPKTRDL